MRPVALHIKISAVRIMSGCPSPGNRSAVRAPITDAMIPAGTVFFTTSQRTSFCGAYLSEPVIAPGRSDGNVVPIAIAAVQPSARIAGVLMTAPPTPNVPDMIPVPIPATMVSASRRIPGSIKLAIHDGRHHGGSLSMSRTTVIEKISHREKSVEHSVVANKTCRNSIGR